MTRRIISVLLALAIIFGLGTAAFAIDKTSAIEALGALGIMNGDENGDLHLGENITRAEFSTMMVRASSFKDSISPDGNGYSLYKDVKSDHWASQYIRLATNQGWLTGFSDGSFQPEENITLEEACTALLRMLGYTSASLEGSYPFAQLNKAGEVGLRDGMQVKMGTEITREDALFLFCNFLKSKTSSGMVYGQTLGYSIVNGEIDYASVILGSMEGPYIAEGGESLGFNPRTIYKNGERADSFALNPYDVFYYNKSVKTVWIYTTKVSGKITALSPSENSPSSVTLGTASYSLGNAAAKYQVSAIGGGGVGKTMTLLLGMNNDVVGTVTGNKIQTIYYGIVNGCTKSVSTGGNAKEETLLRVFCTDGVNRSFNISGAYEYKAGRIVSVSVSGSTVSVKSLSDRSIYGKVSQDASGMGDYEFAEDVNIIDTTTDGEGVKISRDRLAGYTISGSYVRYYAQDSKGRITDLILKDATGDIWSYGMMLAVIESGSTLGSSVSYSFVLGGRLQSYTAATAAYGLEKGGFGIRYGLDGSVKAMKQLEEIGISQLSGLTATASLSSSYDSTLKQYSIDPFVSVYLKKGDTYYSIDLSRINDSEYKLTGYIDSSSVKATGLVRVIVAE